MGTRKGALKRRRGAPATQRAAAQRRAGPALADYEIGELVRHGLVGPVHIARYLPTGVEVAVESVPNHLQNHDAFLSALGEGCAAATQIRTASVVSVYNLVNDDGRLWLISELDRSPTLSAWKRNRTRLSRQEAIRIAAGIVDAVDALHRQGLVHGQLSPDTVAVNADSGARVLGAGLSTALCIAQGGPADEQGDITAAAVIGMELLDMVPSRQRPRAVARLLRQVAAGRGSAGGISAALREALVQELSEQPRRGNRVLLRRRIARAAAVVAPLAAGAAVGLSLTGAGGAPLPRTLVVDHDLRLVVLPASGGCGTEFTFIATAVVHGEGQIAYRWSRSDGVAAPVRRVSVAPPQGSIRLTTGWRLTAPVKGPITMTLHVLSPTAMSASKTIHPACL
jgi:hypothetical protein